jgi:hypothetical protein
MLIKFEDVWLDINIVVRFYISQKNKRVCMGLSESVPPVTIHLLLFEGFLKACNSVDINQSTFKFDQLTNFNVFFLRAPMYYFLFNPLIILGENQSKSWPNFMLIKISYSTSVTVVIFFVLSSWIINEFELLNHIFVVWLKSSTDMDVFCLYV